jgi:hypothetical protein
MHGMPARSDAHPLNKAVVLEVTKQETPDKSQAF